MFTVFVAIFWFSLLFGTYVTGNGLGNWIALLALVLMVRSRRRTSSRRSTAGLQDSMRPSVSRSDSVSPNGVARAPTPAAKVVSSRRRWR